MGIVYADIKLSNPAKSELKSIDIKCLVDTGSTYLCIPEEVALQLDLKELERREVILANAQVISYPYVGPIMVKFEDRTSFVGALVMGNEVLLGAIPMEDMDLVVHPKYLKLAVHPSRPNMAGGFAK